MPNYDYFCTQCGYQEEILQKMMDPLLSECPDCHQSTFKRKFSGGIGLQFQGTGFYVTDYPRESSSANKSPSEGASSSPAKDNGNKSKKECGCSQTSCKT